MKHANQQYWIWLSCALGCGSPKFKALFEMYEDISAFYRGGEKEWRLCGIFTDGELTKLRKTELAVAEKILARCGELGYGILTIEDEEYPACLRDLYHPPAVLYVDGRLPDVDHVLSIGIVGTRTASNYGLKNSYGFGYSLSKYGVIIVSGGALGVDCASHRGALAANGVTVCVLGCGINYPYLKENAQMRKAIALRGAVISEYPPDTPPMPYHFPLRNRIIAALSNGVLMIESGKKSGSLITGDCALELGRELFALMGNNSPNNEGSNERIKEGAAMPVTDFMDILIAFRDRFEQEEEPSPAADVSPEEVGSIPVKGRTHQRAKSSEHDEAVKPAKPVEQQPVHREISGVSGDAEKVYRYLTAAPVHVDKIAAALHLPVFRVTAALTQLELSDLAKAYQGRKYALK